MCVDCCPLPIACLLLSLCLMLVVRCDVYCLLCGIWNSLFLVGCVCLLVALLLTCCVCRLLVVFLSFKTSALFGIGCLLFVVCCAVYVV